MGSTSDKLSGKVKETVGNLTDDESLEREGKVEHAGGTIKEKVGDAVDAVKDKAKDVLHKD